MGNITALQLQATPFEMDLDVAPPKDFCALCDLPIGQSGTVLDVALEGKLRGFVTRFGFIEDAIVTVVRRVPLGGLRIYRVGQAEVALRPETADKILVKRKCE